MPAIGGMITAGKALAGRVVPALEHRFGAQAVHIGRGMAAGATGLPLGGSQGAAAAVQAPRAMQGAWKGAAFPPFVDVALRRLAKTAFGLADAADVAGYGSFIAGKLLPHSNPWHNRLDALGLGILGATTLHGAVTGGDHWRPALKDLVGLGLMGSALYNRATQPSTHEG